MMIHEDVFCPACGIDLNKGDWMRHEDIESVIAVELGTWGCEWRVLHNEVNELHGIIGLLMRRRMGKAERRLARLRDQALDTFFRGV